MKKGAADDPFAEETDSSDDPGLVDDSESQSDGETEEGADRDEQSNGIETIPAGSTSSDLPSVGEPAMATSAGAETGVETETEADSSGPTAPTASQSVDALPYLPQRQLRGQSVKDGRHQVPFFLRNDVQRGEKDLKRAVEDELDQDVNKTDLREAAYMFAQRHPEHVAAMLREWGIDYLE